MYLLDTCILLEILLEQKKSTDCEALISRLRKGEIKGYLTSFSLHSIEVILCRFKKRVALEMFLEDILSLTNLEIVYTNLIDELRVVRIMGETGLDFDDALQYYIAKTKALKLISFDKDYDKTDIKRLEPHLI